VTDHPWPLNLDSGAVRPYHDVLRSDDRIRTRQTRAAGSGGYHPCAGSAEKETSLGITPRVPIAVVVALTGEHFGFVMFAFVSVRCSGNDRSGILGCRCFFRDL